MCHGRFYKPIIVDNSSIKIGYVLNPANCMLFCRGRGRGRGRGEGEGAGVEHILIIFTVNNFSI